MAVPSSFTMAGAKLAKNPKRLGGTIAIVLSIISLIVGGTLLAVGLLQTPSNQPMIIGAIVALVVGVVLFGTGVWLATRKPQKSSVERLQERLPLMPIDPTKRPLPPLPVGTSYDESARSAAMRRIPPPIASDLLQYQSLPADAQRPQYSALPADAQRSMQRAIPPPIVSDLPQFQRPRARPSSIMRQLPPPIPSDRAGAQGYDPLPAEAFRPQSQSGSFQTASSGPSMESSDSDFPAPPGLTASGQLAPVMTERALRAYQRRGALPATRQQWKQAGSELASDPEVRAEAMRLANQLRTNPELRAKLTPKRLQQLERAERGVARGQQFLKENPQLAAFGKQLFDAGLQGAKAYGQKGAKKTN